MIAAAAILAAGAMSPARADGCKAAGLLPAGVVTASWYGAEHHGRHMAGGETYDARQLTAAHPTLPFQTVIQIRNLLNGRIVRVRRNNAPAAGPFAHRVSGFMSK